MENNSTISRRRLLIVLGVGAAILVVTAIAAAIIANRARVNEMRLSGELPGGPTPPPRTVIMKDYMFIPNRITVKKGETVTWVNEDNVPHTVTANSFGGQHVIGPGETFTLDTKTIKAPTPPGEFAYHCDFHLPGMQGMLVIVEPAQ